MRIILGGGGVSGAIEVELSPDPSRRRRRNNPKVSLESFNNPRIHGVADPKALVTVGPSAMLGR